MNKVILILSLFFSSLSFASSKNIEFFDISNVDQLEKYFSFFEKNFKEKSDDFGLLFKISYSDSNVHYDYFIHPDYLGDSSLTKKASLSVFNKFYFAFCNEEQFDVLKNLNVGIYINLIDYTKSIYISKILLTKEDCEKNYSIGD